MRVPFTIELPDQKSSLDSAVLKQFADIAKQLMGMMKEQTSSKKELHSLMMASMEDQREQLLQAMEKLMNMASKRQDTGSTDALVSAVSSLKKAVQGLPKTLKAPEVTVNPKVQVTLPTNALEDFKDAMLRGIKKSRSRTFGSNY